MSRTVSQTKHCSVCFKAGMPEEVYTSHFVRESRDVSSRTTCPIVKNNICGNCGKKGHFKSSCKVTERKIAEIKVSKVVVKTSNKFDFPSDSDSEDEYEDECDD